ncbi:sperm acrosome-associated protein 7 isoform X1 [Bos taurus]|uniref:Sperm acrosome associated 7 n=1 Tax=Bos taurus TaxID=9913 RepID=A0A3Q1LQG1_BOVIN|nr:sperm acrosome-associated protein 7 isoform X1 [Bos taurus]
MAATTGVALLVLLLYGGQGAELPPINVTSGSTTATNNTRVQEDMPGVSDEILVKEMLEPNRSSMPKIQSGGTTASTRLFKEKNARTDESDQLSVPEGFHEFADLSPISLETEDKILNEPSVDTSYGTSGPEGHHESRTSSGAADSLHSNGKKYPKTDQQLKQSVLDTILQNIGKSSGNSLQ